MDSTLYREEVPLTQWATIIIEGTKKPMALHNPRPILYRGFTELQKTSHRNRLHASYCIVWVDQEKNQTR